MPAKQRFGGRSQWPASSRRIVERALIFFGTLLLVSVYALIRGGAPEKIVAALYLFAYALTVVAARIAGDMYAKVIGSILIVDIALVVGLIILSLYANRYWTMWAASFQIVAIFAHFAKLILPGVLSGAYAVTLLVWSYAALPLLMAATYRHQIRITIFGIDRNWSARE